VTDWTTMTRDQFDSTASSVQLALEVCPPTPDPYGTGDLFELLEPALDGSPLMTTTAR
jgi:hypothetical protein